MSLSSKPARKQRRAWESCFVCPCLPLQMQKSWGPLTLAAIVGRALQGPVGCKACLSLWQQPAPGKPEVYVCLPLSADAAGGEKRRGPLGCLPTHPALLPDPLLYKRGTIPQAHTEREPMRRAEPEGGHHQCPPHWEPLEAPPPWKMPAFLGALARGPLWEGTAFCPEFPPSPLQPSPRPLWHCNFPSRISPSPRLHLSSD